MLKKLTEQMGTTQLAKLLPQTAKQIERLTNLKLTVVPLKAQAEQFAIPLVFFVTKQQQGVIENAIEAAAFSEQRVAERTQTTKAQHRAVAITEIASKFLGTGNVKH